MAEHRWRPDRVVIITTRNRADRAGAVRDIALRCGWRVEVLEGVEGTEYPAPPGWATSPQSWACRESHLLVLGSVPAGQSVAVFEDDAALPHDFATLLEGWLPGVPGDWEAVMLGGEHRLRPEPVTTGIVRCARTARTHAYLLRGEAVEVARAACASAIQHWDGPLARALGARGRTYAPDPFLVETTRSPSSIPDSRPLPGGVAGAGYAVR